MSEYKIHGLSWEPDKIVTAAVSEVMPHPNADRLVLCRLYDGEQEHIVLTGAPNLYPYKGLGPLKKPLKVPYAREGARIYDGHQPGQVLTTLKRAKIRGVDSYSMICSEKELGISDEHEGVIILDDDAPVGVPLADYMGDAVFEINIIPNIARAASMLGVAREIAALTGQSLRPPSYDFLAQGSSIDGKAAIEILNPELNPRFVLGLISDIEIKPSPYWVQRRLRLAGMRPINNIVDATNYVMLEIGEPLHAFDYDVLLQRAGGKPPTIITRTAHARRAPDHPGRGRARAERLQRTGVRYHRGTLDCRCDGRRRVRGQSQHSQGASGRRGLELHQHPPHRCRPKADVRSRLPLLARRAPGDGRARRPARAGSDAAPFGWCDFPGAY